VKDDTCQNQEGILHDECRSIIPHRTFKTREGWKEKKKRIDEECEGYLDFESKVTTGETYRWIMWVVLSQAWDDKTWK